MVVVCGQLDREKQDFYLLNITASDGLYITRTAVEVTVMDANDNTPVCNQVRGQGSQCRTRTTIIVEIEQIGCCRRVSIL